MVELFMMIGERVPIRGVKISRTRHLRLHIKCAAMRDFRTSSTYELLPVERIELQRTRYLTHACDHTRKHTLPRMRAHAHVHTHMKRDYTVQLKLESSSPTTDST